MKKKIFITILFLILLVIQFYTIYRVDSLESKVYTKQTQDIEKSKELKVEKLEKKKTEYDTFNDYMQMIFPKDGNYYVEATGTIKFYSDIACTQEIPNPRFISNEHDYRPNIKLENGYKISVYVFLMENDKVCYSPSSITPKLVLENAVH